MLPLCAHHGFRRPLEQSHKCQEHLRAAEVGLLLIASHVRSLIWSAFDSFDRVRASPGSTWPQVVWETLAACLGLGRCWHSCSLGNLDCACGSLSQYNQASIQFSHCGKTAVFDTGKHGGYSLRTYELGTVFPSQQGHWASVNWVTVINFLTIWKDYKMCLGSPGCALLTEDFRPICREWCD